MPQPPLDNLGVNPLLKYKAGMGIEANIQLKVEGWAIIMAPVHSNDHYCYRCDTGALIRDGSDIACLYRGWLSAK